MRALLLASLLIAMPPVWAVGLPAMRPGIWEFIRKAPTDPLADPHQRATVIDKRCVEDAHEFFEDPKNEFIDLCAFSSPRKKGDTYTSSTSCDIPMWNAKLSVRNVTTVHGNSGYEIRFESRGTAYGKPVAWTETVVAKRVGDCPAND